MKRIRHLLPALLLAAGSLAHADPVSGAAQDFALKSVQGKNVKLSELRGKVVLINFWASWCGPCRQEMPKLEQLHRRYHPLGVTLLGVNVDERAADAQRLLKQTPVGFPVLLDSDNRVSGLYSVDAMPTTLLVDRDGNKRFIHRGYVPGYEDQYEAQIKVLLKE